MYFFPLFNCFFFVLDNRFLVFEIYLQLFDLFLVLDYPGLDLFFGEQVLELLLELYWFEAVLHTLGTTILTNGVTHIVIYFKLSPHLFILFFKCIQLELHILVLFLCVPLELLHQVHLPLLFICFFSHFVNCLDQVCNLLSVLLSLCFQLRIQI